jgi:hypothetical protein
MAPMTTAHAERGGKKMDEQPKVSIIDAEMMRRLEQTARGARGITVEEALRLALDSWFKKNMGPPN